MPSKLEIENMIGNGDSLALSKLLQTIYERALDLPCDDLAFYSDQIIGMIKVAIVKKTVNAKALETVSDTAEEEIKRIS